MDVLAHWTDEDRRTLANLLAEHDAESPDVLAREIAAAGFVPSSIHQGAVDLLRRVNGLDLGSNPPDAVLAVLVGVEDWLSSLDHPALDRLGDSA